MLLNLILIAAKNMGTHVHKNIKTFSIKSLNVLRSLRNHIRIIEIKLNF